MSYTVYFHNTFTKKIIKTLDKHFGNPEKTERWLKNKNILLGGVRPWDMIITGRQEKLLKFIEREIDENKLPKFSSRYQC